MHKIISSFSNTLCEIRELRFVVRAFFPRPLFVKKLSQLRILSLSPLPCVSTQVQLTTISRFPSLPSDHYHHSFLYWVPASLSFRPKLDPCFMSSCLTYLCQPDAPLLMSRWMGCPPAAEGHLSFPRKCQFPTLLCFYTLSVERSSFSS